MSIPVNPVAYVELHTQDPAAAGAFYGKLFGWKTVQEQAPGAPYYAFEGQLAGYTAPRDGVPAGWIPYILVPDVKAATAQARELGATVLRDCIAIPPGTFSVIRDPLGGILGLWQPAAR